MNKVFYTGVTGNLQRRIAEHKEKEIPGFTKLYGVAKLVYFETYPDPWSAIDREKQIKAGSRQRKIDLVNGMNPKWRDLFHDL